MCVFVFMKKTTNTTRLLGYGLARYWGYGVLSATICLWWVGILINHLLWLRQRISRMVWSTNNWENGVSFGAAYLEHICVT